MVSTAPAQPPAATAPDASSLRETAPANDTINWSRLAFELELDAIARQIVRNAVVLKYADGTLELGFLPEQEVLLRDDTCQQINRAVEHKLGVSLTLNFSSRPVLPCETPQQAHDREQEQARQQAITQIRQDPVIKKLNALFSASLVESSVKKSDAGDIPNGNNSEVKI